MSQPNPAFRNATYLLTRRCVQRELLLLPTPIVTGIFAYAVARAAAKHRVQVHAALAMTNHWHAVITVSEAVASEFARDVHAAVARCVNVHLDRSEALWSSDGLSLVRLVDRGAIFDKMVYTELNAVAAGLVARPKDWRGFRVTPRDALRKPTRVARPRLFYSKGEGAACPEKVELEVTIPPCFADEGDLEFVERFEKAVKERVKSLRGDSADEGGAGARMDEVLALARGRRPSTERQRGGRRPRIACGDPEVRRQARSELTQFRRAYKRARRLWLEGRGSVTFPYGTHVMAPYPNVEVEGIPPDTARAAA